MQKVNYTKLLVVEHGVSPKGVEEEPFDLKSNDIDTTLNVRDQFKSSLLVENSPEKIAKLQRNDLDLEKGVKPTRDVIAGESPTRQSRATLLTMIYKPEVILKEEAFGCFSGVVGIRTDLQTDGRTDGRTTPIL
ncbi:hypothetical protein DPMN_137731 [Dreissena polymorpha]|uniref:Uncharacterized protein n=1 Tax=Dreissena polymorpha TaxID=45954 RepID=A0A9D4G610_DREPO|nr:hypothetical protein DPMN_137731 [Dreissena polymorpha]